MTFCELQREIDSARSRDFIPRCKEDGRFEEVQCQRKSEECWCVDEAGMEIPQSRTIGLPECDKPNGKGFFFYSGLRVISYHPEIVCQAGVVLSKPSCVF